LVTALEMTLAARAVIQDPHLRSILGRVETLPKPPEIYAELTAWAKDADTSATEFARLVEQDIATTAELLKLVNSSFFGVAREVTSIKQAVTLLGVDVIQALVLAGRTFRPTCDLPADLVAADIAGRGRAASASVRRTGAVEGWPENLTAPLCLAALLYDVGLLVLAANKPRAWAKYCDLRRAIPAREAQLQAFGVTTGQASAYLLGHWGFHPTTVGVLAEQPIALGDERARSTASPWALAVAQAHWSAAATAPEKALIA
jgi:HD-like signal output (HDOD) protein